jgi:predicted metal-dependent hydrolase
VNEQIVKFGAEPVALSAGDMLRVGGCSLPVRLSRNPRARRYILRLKGAEVHVTIPRGGSKEFARSFAVKHLPWLEKQYERLRAQPPPSSDAPIYFRGVPLPLKWDRETGAACLGELSFSCFEEAHLRGGARLTLQSLARHELPPRVRHFVSVYGLDVDRIQVRDQKSRWGSCSARRSISLNWRLVQTPDSVRDYVILHELMHLKEMSHSPRFWRLVENVCPGFREARSWLRLYGARLGV